MTVIPRAYQEALAELREALDRRQGGIDEDIRRRTGADEDDATMSVKFTSLRALLARAEALEAENERLRGERDEAVRDRNAHAEHVRRMAAECEDGLAALETIAAFWEACGVPSNKAHLTVEEQVGALIAELNGAHEAYATEHARAEALEFAFAILAGCAESRIEVLEACLRCDDESVRTAWAREAEHRSRAEAAEANLSIVVGALEEIVQGADAAERHAAATGGGVDGWNSAEAIGYERCADIARQALSTIKKEAGNG